MKALQEITNALKTIRSHREAAENAASQLSTEIGKIDSRGSALRLSKTRLLN